MNPTSNTLLKSTSDSPDSQALTTRQGKSRSTIELTRNILLAVTIVISSISLAGCAALASNGDAANNSHPMASTSPNQDYSNVDVMTYPNDQFKLLPFGVQIDKCAPYFSKAFENGAVEKYLTASKAANGYNMKGDAGTGSIRDSAQELLNRLTVKEYIVYRETNINAASNLASCVYTVDSSPYNGLIEAIANGNNAPPTILDDFGSSEVFTQGSFAQHAANGAPTRIVQMLDPVRGKFVDAIFQEQFSNTDKSRSEVVMIASVGPDSPYYVDDIKNWNP